MKNFLGFFRDDMEEYDKFLLTFKVESTKRRYKRHLEDLFYFNSAYRSILDLQPNDFRDFFSYVNKKEISIAVKRKYKTSILKFLNFLTFNDLVKGEKTLNYTLMMSKITFTVSSSKKYTKMTLKPPIMPKILNDINSEYKIYVKILIFSGCRLGGLVNLEIKNIHFKQRYFETKEKVTKWKGGNNTYFLPEQFIKELEEYCFKLQENKKEKVFNHKIDDFRDALHEYDSRLRPHLFRHAFSSNYQRNGLNDTDLISILINQKPKNVNAQIYQDCLDDIDERKNIYDKYFPYGDVK